MHCIVDVSNLPGVSIVRGDMCPFGQYADTKGFTPYQHDTAPARKPTGWMTNMPTLKIALGVLCDGSHQHVPFIGGRAKPCERYPPKLVTVILRAIIQQLRKDRHTPINATEIGIGPHVDEDDIQPDFSASNADDTAHAIMNPSC